VRHITSTKSRFTLAIGTATLLVSLSVGSVLAGEVTGNGKPTPIGAPGDLDPPHANSICSFSGQNDGNPPLGRTAAHVQSWGQIPKAIRDAIALEGAHPGDACNGHTGFFAGGR